MLTFCSPNQDTTRVNVLNVRDLKDLINVNPGRVLLLISVIAVVANNIEPPHTIIWSVIFMPMPLAQQVPQASCRTHLLCELVPQTVLGMGTGMSVRAYSSITYTYRNKCESHCGRQAPQLIFIHIHQLFRIQYTLF